MAKIVVLDGYTLNPGDLSWDGFEKLGAVEVYERTPPDQVAARIGDAELALTNKTPVTAATFAARPRLRYVGVLATGYNIVDVTAAKAHGVTVTNIPTYGTASVAQFSIALLLELCHHVGRHADAVRDGEWTRSADWCFWKSPQMELAGKTFGVVGFGRIGRQTARIANAMGMRILAHDAVMANPPAYPEFRWAALDELLRESDVVSLHCPLFPDTQGLINAERLRTMKRTAFLLNASRGPLMVDQDLADALDAGVIAGAGVDVLSVEPPVSGNPLFSAKNCVVTPHIAWATKEARARLMGMAADNLAAFLGGKPQNVVS